MIRLLIAEDMHLIRAALVALLSLEPDFEIAAELDRGDEVVAAALRTRPDIALLDIDLPGLDGLAVAGQLATELPECRVIVLSGLGRPGSLLHALQARVRGFIVKNAPARTLIDGIRRVAAGQRVMDPELVTAAVDVGTSPLTDREREVLCAARGGRPTDEIAKQLALSPATVKHYLTRAIAKVGGRNRLEAIRIAEDVGWLR